MADAPDDPGPRVAMLEQIAKATHETLAELRAELRELRTEMRTDFQRLDDRMRAVETGVAQLSGRVSQLPNTWQMLTAVSLGPAVVVGVILIILRFILPH